MDKLKLLDLFCGSGGAAMGYHRAGFEVVGVDINPQKHYPFDFHQADAMTYPLDGFDVIHASCPCQLWARGGNPNRSSYPDLISGTRKRLVATGLPYIIENVPDSPLINPIFLNGYMFNLLVHRPRYFECNFYVKQPKIKKTKPVKMGRPVKDGDIIQPVGHFSGIEYAKKQMEIDWMTQKELAQAKRDAEMYRKLEKERSNELFNIIAKLRRKGINIED